MPGVNVQPAAVAAAATTFGGIGAELAGAHAAAGPLVTTALPPGADDVSVMIATRLNAHGAQYVGISAQSQAVYEEFVTALGAGGASYEEADLANEVLAAAAGLGDVIGDAIGGGIGVVPEVAE